MAIYRFPKDYYLNQDASKTKFEGKLPDYIYTSDERDPSSSAEEVIQEGKTGTYRDSTSGSYPLFFRLLTLLSCSVMTLWASVLFAASLLFSVATLLVFWRSEEMSIKAASFWKRSCKISAIALALFVATLSPSFGFGIAALYFAQRGEKKPSFFDRLKPKP